jgi:AGZA family xanthine/uracil permease-like MFS transporter
MGVCHSMRDLLNISHPYEIHLPGEYWIFISSGIGTIIGSMIGCTPIIVAVESITGIQDGARTGLSAIVTSFCFLITILFAPLFNSIPLESTSGLLILVGTMMMIECNKINWKSMLDALPAFLCICLMPFTFSIANGKQNKIKF